MAERKPVRAVIKAPVTYVIAGIALLLGVKFQTVVDFLVGLGFYPA